MTNQPEVPPIKDIRGGIVLCEMCQPMLNGKWLVVGTYSFYRVFGDVWRSAPLQCYVRIQVETPGEYPASIKLINRALPSNRPAIHTMDFTFRVTDPLQLVELACQLPPLEVHSPCPLADMRDGHAYGVPLLLWLRVRGIDLASSPLNVIFRAPSKGIGHDPAADHPRPTPVDPV